MRNRLWVRVVVCLLAAAGGRAVAQDPDARTLLQTSLKAMGGRVYPWGDFAKIVTSARSN